jgi:hypothetical protein
MAGKNMRRRHRRVYEASSRERIRVFFEALFRRGEQTEISVPPDEPPTASAGVVAIPLGPYPSAGSAEANPDSDDS